MNASDPREVERALAEQRRLEGRPKRLPAARPDVAIILRAPLIYADGKSAAPRPGDSASLKDWQLREMIAAVEEARAKGYLSAADAGEELKGLRVALASLKGKPRGTTVGAMISADPFPMRDPRALKRRAEKRTERQARKKARPPKKRKSKKRR